MSLRNEVAHAPCVEPCSLGLTLPESLGALPTDEQLCAFARTLRLTADAWTQLAPHVGFDARQYRRVRLFRDATWEALLLCWLPGQGTSVHDHGGSVGVSVVLSGCLQERRWVRVREGEPLAAAGEMTCVANEASVESLDTIHEMRNTSAQPAISLHLYSPPLSRLGAHDPALGTRWEVPVADTPDVQIGGDPNLLD